MDIAKSATQPDEVKEYVKQLRTAFVLLGGLLVVLMVATVDRISLRGDLERYEEQVFAERLLAKRGVGVGIDPTRGFASTYNEISAYSRAERLMFQFEDGERRKPPFGPYSIAEVLLYSVATFASPDDSVPLRVDYWMALPELGGSAWVQAANDPAAVLVDTTSHNGCDKAHEQDIKVSRVNQMGMYGPYALLSKRTALAVSFTSLTFQPLAQFWHHDRTRLLTIDGQPLLASLSEHNEPMCDFRQMVGFSNGRQYFTPEPPGVTLPRFHVHQTYAARSDCSYCTGDR